VHHIHRLLQLRSCQGNSKPLTLREQGFLCTNLPRWEHDQQELRRHGLQHAAIRLEPKVALTRVLVRLPPTKSINSRTILIRLSKGSRKLFSIDMYHAWKESWSTIATRLVRDQCGRTEFLHHYQYILSHPIVTLNMHQIWLFSMYKVSIVDQS
jgi:hypothetical protein